MLDWYVILSVSKKITFRNCFGDFASNDYNTFAKNIHTEVNCLFTESSMNTIYVDNVKTGECKGQITPKITPSYYFTLSSQFSSSEFSPSLKFSNSDYFAASGTFTPSYTFTPSNFFTPIRTKVPDPQNIFYRNNQVGGSNISIFSKEEVKNAAVPLTFLAVLSAAAIVMFAFYLTHHIKKVKNSDNIPNFDSSFDDVSLWTVFWYDNFHFFISFIFDVECIITSDDVLMSY